ncbi:MAG: hypothetical protein JOZ24_12350, partial [Candidatus Eremiobacteraeota bacterium]|nr:hypothetical protein [Candidatus Eremiobacteraeota bacterium]
MISQRYRWLVGCAAVPALLWALSQPAAAAVTRVIAPAGALSGMRDAGPADPRTLLHVAIELQPRADLDALALRASDPSTPEHAHPLSRDAFIARFGRVPDARVLGGLLRSAGASDVDVAGDGLVVGGILDIPRAERLFGTRWEKWTDGKRTIAAPAGALAVPAANVRDVRGVVTATTPRLADARPSFTYFRGDWYEPVRFRSMTDAAPDAGTGQRIVLVEDASDRFDLSDVQRFLSASGAPPGASMSRVAERSFVFKSAASQCGRDDRGQEPALDTDAALTMAPLAEVVVDYDDVCAAGNDATLALARALDLDPTQIAFPFVVGPVDGPLDARYGRTPLPLLEAVV